MKLAPRVYGSEIPVVTPAQALDAANKHYLLLLVFAYQEDFSKAWNVVSKKCSLLGIHVVRVEPLESHAVDLQMNKHPCYVLYRSGNEDFLIVGTNAFISKIDSLRL